MQDDLPQLKDIENSLVIFVMATYGEGDPTDNAHELHEWLQNDQDLEGVTYAVRLITISSFISLWLYSTSMRLKAHKPIFYKLIHVYF